MNKMLPCPCCGRAVFGEWKSRTDLGLGWIKGEYEIFCGCGLRMVASANVEAKNLNIPRSCTGRALHRATPVPGRTRP